jgi:hypothetical protein
MMRPVRFTLSPSYDADRVLLEVQRQAEDAVRRLEQLAHHAVLQAVDPGDAVADRDDRPLLADVDASLETLDLLPEDARDLVRFDLRHQLTSSRVARYGGPPVSI